MFPPVSTSDHQLILCRWKCTARCWEPASQRPNFNKADYGAMSTVLASVNWRQIFSECSTVNDYWLALYRVLKTVIRDFVPVTTCLSHRHSTRRQRVLHEVHAAIIHKRKAGGVGKQLLAQKPKLCTTRLHATAAAVSVGTRLTKKTPCLSWISTAFIHSFHVSFIQLHMASL